MGFEGGRRIEAEGRAWRKLETGIAKAIALDNDAAMQLVFGLGGGAGWAAGLLNLRKAAGRVQVPCSLTMPDLSSGGRRKRIGVVLVSVKWRLTSPVASLQLKPGHPPSSSPLLLFLPSPQQPPIIGFTTQLVVLVAPKRSWSNALRPAPSGARLGLLCPLPPPFHSTLGSTRCRRRRLTVLCCSARRFTVP